MDYKEPTKQEKASIIVFSLIMISIFLYFALRNNSIEDKDLQKVKVTLKDAPQYDSYKIKSTTYRDIVLKTHEFEKVFKITGMTYRATDHKTLKDSIFAGDIIEIKVKSEDFAKLNSTTIVNNYNEVYGLKKNGVEYIDLDSRTRLKDKDSYWAYCFVLLGAILLPYGFIKGKPKISMPNAALLIFVLAMVMIFILRKD